MLNGEPEAKMQYASVKHASMGTTAWQGGKEENMLLLLGYESSVGK